MLTYMNLCHKTLIELKKPSRNKNRNRMWFVIICAGNCYRSLYRPSPGWYK